MNKYNTKGLDGLDFFILAFAIIMAILVVSFLVWAFINNITQNCCPECNHIIIGNPNFCDECGIKLS